MKRLLLTITAMSFLLGTAPEPHGNWKLSGLSVDYLHIARETTPFWLTVDYPGLPAPFSTASDCSIRNDEGDWVANPNPSSVCVFLQDVPEGVMFNRLTNGPFTNSGLGGIGVNLNVNIYDNGFGTIAQGSFYPDIELSESQDCVTDLQIFAVNENFSWEVGTETTFSEKNVLGMENGLLCDDDTADTYDIECTENTDVAYGFGLVTGLFDATPSTPVPVALPPGLPYVALTDGTVLGASCQTALVGAACAALDPPISAADDADGCAYALVVAGQLSATQDGTGPLEQTILQCEMATNPNLEMNANKTTAELYAAATVGPDGIPSALYPDLDSGDDWGGAGWLHGTGTSSKFNLGTNLEDNASAMCTDAQGNPIPGDGQCNPDVDFKLVWHALDSKETGLGFGDIDYPETGWDEDNDGSEFDRIFGVPYITTTSLDTTNPLCDISGGTAKGNAWTLPVAGDIVGELGSAGCGDNNPMTLCCTEDNPYFDHLTRSGVRDCGEYVVNQFIKGSCIDQVADVVEAPCQFFGSPFGFIQGSCNASVLEGTIELCDDNGGAANFATGICATNVQDNIDSCGTVIDDAGTVLTWQGIVAGVCASLGVDCTENIPAAQTVFDGACYVASGGTATTCAELASATGDDLVNLECGMLSQMVDADNDASTGVDGNETPFYLGACANVVAPIIGELLGADGDCTSWISSFDQTAMDSFAQNADLTGDGNVDGYTCAQFAGGATAALGAAATMIETCSSPDWHDAMFTSSSGALAWTCTDYGNNFMETCVEDPSTDTEMYLFKPGAGLEQFGDFMTYNSTAGAFVGQDLVCSDGTFYPGADVTAEVLYECYPGLLDDDSDHDFDPTCMYDGNPFNTTENADGSVTGPCSGRLKMVFEPTCVPEIEARQIVAEFVDLTELCDHSGDVDYNCYASDFNYNYQADCASNVDGQPDCVYGSGDGDGTVTQAECQQYADDAGLTFAVNPIAVLPSCDEEAGETPETHSCTSLSGYAIWNSQDSTCGDGDPNDLIYLGSAGFCAASLASDANPFQGSLDACLYYYSTQQGGVPSFEQECVVGGNGTNVSDVIRIIAHIIGNDALGTGDSENQLGGEAACEADLTGDGIINVIDVVQLVNNILSGGSGRVADATEASISIENDKIVVNSDGYIGGVDMIVKFTDNFSFELADNFAADYKVNGNKAHIILVGDKEGVSEVLTMTSGKIVSIEEILVANSSDFVTTSINQPSTFSVGAAYPNPFNPSTNISLVLNANADLSVKVYNLTGQLVDVIAEGNYSPSSYNWTWKAENLASGVYFIKAQVGSEISTQKVMLLK